MTRSFEKCCQIRRIVKLRQMLRQWRARAASSATTWRFSSQRIPSDVPAGHVAVCVGSSCRRFVVRTAYLNHPVFRKLLAQAEEEYGFAKSGPLAIPCDESLFEEVLRHVSSGSRVVSLEDFQKSAAACQAEVLRGVWHGPGLPLLQSFAGESSVW